MNFFKKIKNIVGIDRTIDVLKSIVGGLISVEEVSCSGIAALIDYLYMSLKRIRCHFSVPPRITWV